MRLGLEPVFYNPNVFCDVFIWLAKSFPNRLPVCYQQLFGAHLEVTVETKSSKQGLTMGLHKVLGLEFLETEDTGESWKKEKIIGVIRVNSIEFSVILSKFKYVSFSIFNKINQNQNWKF